MGAIRASLGPVGLAGAKLLGFEVPMRQFECEWICSRTAFCFANISPPFNRTKKVLYSKFAYGSQFSEEKKHLKIGYLVTEIFRKKPSLFHFGPPSKIFNI